MQGDAAHINGEEVVTHIYSEGIVPFAFTHDAVDGGSSTVIDVDGMGDVGCGGITEADIGIRCLQLFVELCRDGVIVLLCRDGGVVLEIAFAGTDGGHRLAKGRIEGVFAVDVVTYGCIIFGPSEFHIVVGALRGIEVADGCAYGLQIEFDVRNHALADADFFGLGKIARDACGDGIIACWDEAEGVVTVFVGGFKVVFELVDVDVDAAVVGAGSQVDHALQ